MEIRLPWEVPFSYCEYHLHDELWFFFTWLYFVISVQDRLLRCYDSSFKHYIQVFGEIALTFQTPITIIYWGFLHDTSLEGIDLFMEINTHLLPISLLFIDMIFNPFTYHLSHYLFVFIAGTFYLLVNLSYALLHEPTYNILPWNDYMSYVYAVAAYASSFVMLGIAKLISYCWKEKALYDEEQINPIISSEHVLVSQKKNAKAG